MTDYAAVRAALLAKQRELCGGLETIRATEEHEVEEGLNDGAQLWEVSEIRDGLDAAATTELNAVIAALARLDAGEYGSCESCGDPIGEMRLRALPYATQCIECAERAETEGVGMKGETR